MQYEPNKIILSSGQVVEYHAMSVSHDATWGESKEDFFAKHPHVQQFLAVHTLSLLLAAMSDDMSDRAIVYKAIAADAVVGGDWLNSENKKVKLHFDVGAVGGPLSAKFYSDIGYAEKKDKMATEETEETDDPGTKI